MRISLFIACLMLPWMQATAQRPAEWTVEWINGQEAALVQMVPSHVWLKDGSAILHGPKTPGEGTPVRLDPASGATTPLFDRVKVSAAMRAAGLAERVDPGFPEEIDPTGRRATYMIEDDIWVLDFAAATFTRVTETPEEEKSPRFSPSGDRLAFVRQNDLYAHDLLKGETKRLTADGSETILNGTVSWVYWEEIFGRQDLGFWWSDDDSAIAFLRTDESPVTLMTYQSFAPAIPTLLSQRYPKAGTANPVVTVGVISLAGDGKTTWVGFGDAHYEYVARVKWLPDSRRVSVQTMNRAQTRLDLWFADRTSGKANLVLTESDPAWVNIHDDLYFLKDGAHFLWASERTGFAHLYRYTMDGKLVNAVTKGEFAIRDAGGIFWLRQAVKGIDQTTGTVFVTAQEKSAIESHLYRVGVDGEGWMCLTESSGKHKISMSPDGKHYFDEFSNLATPPALTLHEASGEPLKVIAEAFTAPLEGRGLCLPELITVPARDGFAMPGWVMKPKDFDPAKKYPVIFYCYGGPSAPSVANAWDDWLFYNQILLQNGFCVVCVDNRSATAISHTLESTILNQMYGEGELNDLVDAVHWMKKQPWVDPRRVGIWGWSGGGTMTLMGMTRSKEFKAGIAVAAVTKWEYYDTKWAEQVMKLPADNKRGYQDTDLVRRARNLSGRLLLVHGTYDDNVHFQNCLHFINELVAAGKLHELALYPMRQHGISDPPAFKHLQRTMIDFWLRNL